MSQYKRIFWHTKTLVISALAISITACSAGNENTSSPTNSAGSPSTASSQTTSSSASLGTLGVKSIEEINFKPVTGKSFNGHFDTINGSGAPTIEVSKANPITASGWAILPEQVKQADKVIITSGENNSLVAVAPVTSERADVAKELQNSAYLNSGWSTTIDPSTLPTDKVMLKAWAYSSATKEATQLNSMHEVIVLN